MRRSAAMVGFSAGRFAGASSAGAVVVHANSATATMLLETDVLGSRLRVAYVMANTHWLEPSSDQMLPDYSQYFVPRKSHGLVAFGQLSFTVVRHESLPQSIGVARDTLAGGRGWVALEEVKLRDWLDSCCVKSEPANHKFSIAGPELSLQGFSGVPV